MGASFLELHTRGQASTLNCQTPDRLPLGCGAPDTPGGAQRNPGLYSWLSGLKPRVERSATRGRLARGATRGEGEAL